MRYFLLTLFLVVTCTIMAQQEAQFSQYYNNAYFFNPAASGLTKTIQFDVGYRRQWLGIDGTPQSFYATGHSEIKIGNRKKVIEEFNVDRESIFKTPSNRIGKNKHVIGARLLSDQIGPFLKNSVMGSYSYHLRFTNKTMLSLGVSAGWSNLGLNSSKVILLEEEDAKYNEFLSRNSNQNIFDINAGIAFYSEKFHFGISNTQLLKNDLVIDDIVTQSNFGRHWYGYGMYKFDLVGDFVLEPHFMAQIIGKAPFSFNLGSRVIYENKYWVNVAYRFGDAINFGLGLNFANNFSFGYAYDVAAGPVQRTSNFVHELQLGFTIGNNRNVEKELDNEEKL